MIKTKNFENEIKLNEFIKQNSVNVISIETLKEKYDTGLPLLNGGSFISEIDVIKVWYEEEIPPVNQLPLKFSVNGSLLLFELMQVADFKNVDGMPVVKYVGNPNGGSVAYLRHDAVVKRLDNMIREASPSTDEAGVVALKILEKVTPTLCAQEQALFVAGFQECIKWQKLMNTQK